MKIVYLIIVVVLFAGCNNRGKSPEQSLKTDKGVILSSHDTISQAPASPNTTIKPEAQNPASNAGKKTKYTFTIITAPQNTFGYEISADGTPIVRQDNKPGMPGIQGFNTKEKAEKTARFVISKLEKNIMPPTVSEKELDSLGVLK